MSLCSLFVPWVLPVSLAHLLASSPFPRPSVPTVPRSFGALLAFCSPRHLPVHSYIFLDAFLRSARLGLLAIHAFALTTHAYVPVPVLLRFITTHFFHYWRSISYLRCYFAPLEGSVPSFCHPTHCLHPALPAPLLLFPAASYPLRCASVCYGAVPIVCASLVL